MEILNRYSLEKAFYAQVQMPDGSQLEFKIKAEEEPANAEFLALAKDYWRQATAEPERIFQVECEDRFNA